MARVNRANSSVATETFEGAPARKPGSKEELTRIALTAMLWEDSFYEKGSKTAERLAAAIHSCDGKEVVEIAIRSREEFKLRHVPLLMARELCRHKDRKYAASLIERIVQRADELSEFCAIYWKDKREPLSAQAKKGLARAFRKFDAYQLSKYNRDNAVKLRDVLFLCCPKPKDEEQAATWKKLVDGTLESPDTWEVELSASKDKKASWTRLLQEKKLGALALLRNLRNMTQAGIDPTLISDALKTARFSRVLPFRFIAAAKENPQLEPLLEEPMLRAAEGFEKLPGRTVLLIDVSGSMDYPLSAKSKMQRMDTACGLAILARELCESVRVFAFSDSLAEIPARRGYALRDAIVHSMPHSGTYLGNAVQWVNKNAGYDRILVITDEQSHDIVPNPVGKGYLMNVASYDKTVNFGGWTTINGFSEAALQYIGAAEAENLTA